MSSDVRTFTWDLGELPSTQHRAGLAGLLLMTRWRDRHPERQGVCRVVECGPQRLTLELDLPGLEDLFSHVYGATEELQPYSAPFKGKEPIREEEVEEEKNGQTKRRTLYYYPVVVPKGAFLQEQPAPWLKLWRHMVWQIPRGIPAQRKPFEARARREPPKDAQEAWKALRGDGAVALGSTLFLGAQSATAESVPFRDRARMEFLLHFQPFTWQVYVPSQIERDGRTKLPAGGYAILIPDVADLEGFAEEYPDILRSREEAMLGYRPRAAVVDLPVESALAFQRAFRERVQRSMDDGGVLNGCEVMHLEKQGNNIRLLGLWRMEPDRRMSDEYVRVREGLHNPLFRRQRLLNLLERRPWWSGFDRVAALWPQKLTIGDRWFTRDARQSFKEHLEEPMAEEKSIEMLVYGAVQQYVGRRLDEKYQQRWEDVKALKEDDPKRGAYREQRQKLARQAFLAVRGRTDADFVEYFVGTLCSGGQRLNQSDYLRLAAALSNPEERAHVRTLTLLALSAQA